MLVSVVEYYKNGDKRKENLFLYREGYVDVIGVKMDSLVSIKQTNA
jgi:hypothetical protein